MKTEYQRKTRDRYHIYTRPKHTKAPWVCVLDTYDVTEYREYHDAVTYPLWRKIETVDPFSHEFKFEREREHIKEDQNT